MSQSAFVLQLVVSPLQQLGHRMGGKKLRRDPLLGRFPGDRFRAVLAELERRRVFLVGPGTSWTVKPIRLVGPVQQQRRLDNLHLLAYRLRRGPHRTPTARGTVVRLDSGYVAFYSHGSLILERTHADGPPILVLITFKNLFSSLNERLRSECAARIKRRQRSQADRRPHFASSASLTGWRTRPGPRPA